MIILGFRGVILHYSKFYDECYSSLGCPNEAAGGLDCPTLFFNFLMGLLVEEVKPS